MKPSALAPPVPQTDIAPEASFQPTNAQSEMMNQVMQGVPGGAPAQYPTPDSQAPQEARPSLDDIFKAPAKPSLDEIFKGTSAPVEDKILEPETGLAGIQQQMDLNLNKRLGPEKLKKYIAEQNAKVTQANMEEVPASVSYKLGTAEDDSEKENLLKMLYPGAEVSKDSKLDAFNIKTADGKQLTTSKKGELTAGDITKYGSDIAGIGANIAVDAGLSAVTAAMSGPAALGATAAIGAAGATADKAVRDYLANQAGIPRDTSTWQKASNALMGGIFNLGGKVLMNSIAGKATASTAAKDLSEIAGDSVTKKLNGNLAIIEDAMKSGDLVPDSRIPNTLLPSELAGAGEGTVEGAATSANFRGQESTMQKNKTFTDALVARNEVINKYFNKVVNSYADLSEQAGLGFKDVSNKLKSALSIDGQNIGQYTRNAVKNNPSAEVNLNSSKMLFTPGTDGAESLAEKIGLEFSEGKTSVAGKLIPEQIGKLVLKDVEGKEIEASTEALAKKISTQVADRANADKIAGIVEDLAKNLYGSDGKMSLVKANDIRRNIEGALRSSYQDGGAYGMLKDIQRSFNDDFLATVEKFVPEGSAQSYAQSKAQYATNIKVQDTLQKLVGNKEEIFPEAFYKNIFENKDATTLPNVLAALGNDPTAKKQLFGKYVGNLLDASKKDIYSVAAKLDKLPKATKELIAGSPEEFKRFTGMLKIVDSAASSIASANSTEAGRELSSKALGVALGGHGMAEASFITKLADYVTSDKRITEHLAGKTIEPYLKGIPEKSKQGVASAMSQLIMSADNKIKSNKAAELSYQAGTKATQQKIRKAVTE